MSANTKIEWTDETWNPMIGCSKVSEGCRNCYAMGVAHIRAANPLVQAKFGGTTKREGGKTTWTGKVNLSEPALVLPVRWERPRNIFVNSMSDLFHEAVPDAWIDRVFAVMALAPQHQYQILTKRPERMRRYMGRIEQTPAPMREVVEALTADFAAKGRHLRSRHHAWPPPNVWLGVSCEDQQAAAARIPLLRATPAAVRFVSAEPLIGPVSLRECMDTEGPPLDWVIVGGESGPGARPCGIRWIHSILEACRENGIACFIKQLGANPTHAPESTVEGTVDGPVLKPRASRKPLRDKKGGEPSEWPPELRVRQFPELKQQTQP